MNGSVFLYERDREGDRIEGNIQEKIINMSLALIVLRGG